MLEYLYFNLIILLKMRPTRNNRLVTSDLRKIQKNVNDKVEKQIQSLRQLIQLPDFDVFQFFQTLMKSSKQDEVLNKIPKEKKIDFFSRNYVSYIETQQQLSKLKLPVLEKIPKARQFYFQQPQLKEQEERFEQSSVIEIVDSFSISVLQKNTEETMRILQIIKQMKQHEKYQQYFNVFAIEELFRESYETFLQNCEDNGVLVQLNQVNIAIKKFLKLKTSNFIVKIRSDLYVDNSAQAIKKIMYALINFIEKIMLQVKNLYPSTLIDQTEVAVILAQWISHLIQDFYQNIQGAIYEKEEVSDVLQALDVILEASVDFQSKGVNLSRDFKTLVSNDLPAHMNKIVEVVVEAFEDILDSDNQLYQFKYFDGLSSFSFLDDILVPVKEADYGKKCCSQKGILLINSFVIILEPLCDKKWEFLLGNIIQNLLQKVGKTILNSNWQYWDYFQLFHFFQRLQNGKVKHKKLFDAENIPLIIKQQLNLIKKLSYECWQTFEQKITKIFWNTVLLKIPQLLYQIKPYIESKSQSSSIKPTLLSMDLIFKIQQFFRLIEFRLQKPQFEHLVIRFYQYILYVIEYIIYWEYHNHGQKQKVFMLYKISERILKKTKIFAIEELDIVKDKKNILHIGRFTPIGVENLSLDLYFLTQIIKIQTEYNKLNCEQFVQKLAQIEAKEHKSKDIVVSKQKFQGSLDKFIKIYKQQPEKIKQYVESKRKEQTKSSKVQK